MDEIEELDGVVVAHVGLVSSHGSLHGHCRLDERAAADGDSALHEALDATT